MIQSIIKLIKYTDVKYVKKQMICIVLLVINTGLSLIYPNCISLVIDYGIEQENFRRIIYYSLFLLTMGVFILVTNYLYQIQCGKLGREICGNLRNTIFTKLCRTNYEFWNKNKVGNVLTILDTDVSRIEKFITTFVSNGILNIFSFIGVTIILMLYEVKIGILTSLGAIVFALLQKKNGYRVKMGMSHLRDKMGEVNACSQEIINNMPDVSLMYSEEKLTHSYINKNEEMNKAYISQLKNMLNAKSLGMGFNTLAIFLSLLLGASDVLRGKMTIGVLFSVVIYVQQLYSPVLALGEVYSSLKNTQPILGRIMELIKDENVMVSGKYVPEKTLQGNIRFEDVTFSYSNIEKEVFNQFNLEIQGGNIYGIIGDNGAGKSTLIRLLTGLCTPQKGEIYIDDVPLKEYKGSFLREKIGYLLQNPYLLSGIVEDVELQQNNWMISEEMELKENSKGVSGGENQKMALFRLLSGLSKDIYILDEPTSAVDIKSEKKICSYIKETLKGKTVLIVTHRPAILEICDEVINLSQ